MTLRRDERSEDGPVQSPQRAPSGASRVRAVPTPGPWHECGADRGGCECGQVWAEKSDHPVAIVTRGKWGDDYPSLRFVEGTGSIDAKVEAFMDQNTYGEVPMEEAKANARLIAAAPDLLAACVTALSWLGQYGEHSPTHFGGEQQLQDALNAALAKAGLTDNGLGSAGDKPAASSE